MPSNRRKKPALSRGQIGRRFNRESFLPTSGGGALDDPPGIAAIRAGREIVHRNHSDWNFGLPLEPFVYFSVAIGKAETTGSVMITGRQVNKCGWISRVHDRPAIIDAVRMLIDKDPKFRRNRIYDVGHLLITPEIRIPMRTVHVMFPFVGVTLNKPIHSHAADTRKLLASLGAQINVRRTFVDADVLGVRADF